jgi:dipeptidyl aminopeptidase/acylaminoacyl peptidase
MFFFHGTDDELVSIGSPRRMFRRLKEVGVAAEIHEVAGASHMFAAIDREALGRALAFVDRYLKAGASTVDEYSPSGRQSHRETTHGE